MTDGGKCSVLSSLLLGLEVAELMFQLHICFVVLKADAHASQCAGNRDEQ